MAERDLRRADLLRDPIQDAAPQPRAQRARRGAIVEDVVDCLADAGVLDAIFPAARLTRPRDQVVLVLLVAGIDVDRDERERDRRALAEHVEDLEQRPAVLASREADHDAIAVLDHLVIDNRLRCLFRETRFEFALVSHSLIHARLKGSRYGVPRRGGVSLVAAACQIPATIGSASLSGERIPVASLSGERRIHVHPPAIRGTRWTSLSARSG